MTDLKLLDHFNIWHPFTPLTSDIHPVLVTHAEGVYLYTDDGRKIIDAISSWWVNLHGHAHPYISEAVAAQAKKLEHVIFAGFTHEPAIRLSQNILSILPDKFSKIFFSDNGSTAVEVAVKMGMQYWHNQGKTRKKIIALEGAYHGDTFGAMSVGDRSIFSAPFSHYLFDVEFIPFPGPFNPDSSIDQFEKLINEGDVGIFIYEPLLQGAGGMRTYSSETLTTLLHMAKDAGIICIADEVFTGFGRTGKMLASDYVSIKPDLICLSKGLTGGTMPLGITATSDKIVSAFQSDEFLKTFFHGHSFTGNPIACAAANASFDLLMKPGCAEQIQHISDSHSEFAKQLAGHSSIQEVRNIGTILAIELRSDHPTAYANDLRKKIYSYFLERDILLRPLGNTFYLVPPYCIATQELKTIYNAVTDFLALLDD